MEVIAVVAVALEGEQLECLSEKLKGLRKIRSADCEVIDRGHRLRTVLKVAA
jgi:hypothetical protein